MKFICNDCQRVMDFVENAPAADGSSLAIRYGCPNCGRSISMVTNAGETQVVRSLGVTIGHAPLTAEAAAPAPTAEPMRMIRDALAGGAAPAAAGPEPVWSETALKRLAAAPTFVQGMIHRLYSDYARRQGYAEVTPAVMSEARDALGLTGM